jgi:hypothetical protein
MTRRTRLAVHLLEGREVPGGLGDVPIYADPIGGLVPGQGAANKAPVISDFRAVVGPNGRVTFSGRVTDDTAVAGYIVRISGPGVETYAIVGQDGTFSTTTRLVAIGSVSVSATTTDSSGAKSDPVYTTFTPIP